MISGIYTITNKVDGKIYLGYTSNFKKRERDHFNALRINSHPSLHLQASYNKYGEENFIFEILEEYPNEPNILNSMEHYWANLLGVHNRDKGYNIRGTHPYGNAPMSEESKSRIGKGNSGKKQTPEMIAKRLKSRYSNPDNIGKKYKRHKPKEEVGANISKALTGRKIPQEQIERTLATKKRMREEKLNNKL